MKGERLSWQFRLKEIYKYRIWPVIHRLATPLVWLRRRLRPHKTPFCRVTGTVNGGDQPLTLLFGGAEQDKHYFLEQAFGDTAVETSLGQAKLLDVFKTGRRPEKEAAMVVQQTNESMHGWLNDGGWFFIPSWVTGDIHLPVPEANMRQDTVKTIFRKIRKYGFEYEVTQDEERFKDFYNHMHLPYITKVFGKTAKLDSYAEKRAGAEVFDLILLRKKDQPEVFLAGCLLIYEAAGPRLWCLGVRDGNMDLVQEGVMAALYIFSFEHLVKTGAKRINMGSSRPFLRDGVIRFKRKFAMTIVNGQWTGYSMKILALTPATRFFLLNNPFIFRAHGRLQGAVFTEAALSVEAVAKIDHEYSYAGLARLVIYSLNEGETFTTAGLPPELAARIEIRPASEVVSGRLNLPK